VKDIKGFSERLLTRGENEGNAKRNAEVQNNAHSMHSPTKQPETSSPARVLAAPGG
jgi:hypothetical protein